MNSIAFNVNCFFFLKSLWFYFFSRGGTRKPSATNLSRQWVEIVKINVTGYNKLLSSAASEALHHSFLSRCAPERRDLPAVACRARHRLWFGGWKGASAARLASFSSVSILHYLWGCKGQRQHSIYWTFEYFWPTMVAFLLLLLVFLIKRNIKKNLKNYFN